MGKIISALSSSARWLERRGEDYLSSVPKVLRGQWSAPWDQGSVPASPKLCFQPQTLTVSSLRVSPFSWPRMGCAPGVTFTDHSSSSLSEVPALLVHSRPSPAKP